MTDSPQSIFHDPLSKTPNSQDSQRVTAPSASEFQGKELFVAPAIQNLGRNHKIGQADDDFVYVVFGPDGTRVEELDDPAEGAIQPPFEPVNYLKLISDNLPPSKSTGRSRRRNRNR